MTFMYPGPTVPDIGGRDLCGGGDQPAAVDRADAEYFQLQDIAISLVDGDRQADYGEPVENMRRIGECWRAAFGWDASPRHVALAMIFVKAVREANKPKQDNLVDVHGYADIAARCVEAEGA